MSSLIRKTIGPRNVDLGKYSSLSADECDSARPVSRWLSRKIIPAAMLSLLGALATFYWFHSTELRSTYASSCSSEKHVVLASTASQDVAWLNGLPRDWSVKRYIMDDLNPDPSIGLSVPRLYGREAMAYLTYIIDHYDCLPSYAVFIHGHERSWHQMIPMAAKIRALNLTALQHEDYVSFRCEDNMGCERLPYIDTENVNWDGEKHMSKFFHYILPHEPSPRHVSYKCCGQHAVTAAAIRRRSKDDWTRIRSPLLMEEVEMEANHDWGRDPTVNEWLLGAWYEKYWHVFFGMNSQHCPSLERCRQIHFSNAVVCDGDTDLTPYEGETWKDVECRTVFDGVARDEEPDWDGWYQGLLALSGDMRETKAKKVQAQKDRLKELGPKSSGRSEL